METGNSSSIVCLRRLDLYGYAGHLKSGVGQDHHVACYSANSSHETWESPRSMEEDFEKESK